MFTWKVSQQIHTIITKVNTKVILRICQFCSQRPLELHEGGLQAQRPPDTWPSWSRSVTVQAATRTPAACWRSFAGVPGSFCSSLHKEADSGPVGLLGPCSSPSPAYSITLVSLPGGPSSMYCSHLNTNIIILNLGKIKGTSEAALCLTYSIIPLDQGWENWFLSGR